MIGTRIAERRALAREPLGMAGWNIQRPRLVRQDATAQRTRRFGRSSASNRRAEPPQGLPLPFPSTSYSVRETETGNAEGDFGPSLFVPAVPSMTVITLTSIRRCTRAWAAWCAATS